jgi:predicted O-methyltransferase YrrM
MTFARGSLSTRKRAIHRSANHTRRIFRPMDRIAALRRVKRAPRALQEALEDRRLLAHRPGHYYSPVPPFDELLARPLPTDSDIAGVNLNERGQRELLRKLASLHTELPTDPTAGWRYYSANDFYAAADGIVLHTMLRHLRPRHVVEIGSGFSSALMLDTDERYLDGETRFTFIDPEPERLLGLLRDADHERANVIADRLQNVSLDLFDQLDEGDVLFVDSSHCSKTGGDANVLVLDVLPRLAVGVYVHFHDAFWPFEYPRAYLEHHWAWNELYLLRAFLAFNHAFTIALFPSFLEARYRDELGAALPLALTHPPAWPTIRGASIWLRRED